jgi:beta-glucosidase
MKRILYALILISLMMSACMPSSSQLDAPVDLATEALDSEFIVLELTPQDRATDLLARMTLDEKIGQMTLVEKGSIRPDAVTRYFIGSILSGGGGSPDKNTTEAWADMVDKFQEAALKTRLAIPILYGVDAVHGHANLKGAVVFPHNIGLGATGDTELVRRIGEATAKEMAATNIRWNFAPVIAVVQDIRWGRTYEAFSENTALVAEMGVAYLEGLQGESLSNYMNVFATPKHYIGDGGTSWGTSTTPGYKIDQGDLQVDEATLRELFLPPYQAAIEAGAQAIMVSFSSWNGTKMHAQKYLITDVLKNELGFEGFVVSDWQGIDQIDPDYYTAVVTAVNAGIDMNMVPHAYMMFIDTVKLAVEKGDISMERIDDAVRRILTVKFSMGLFEEPYSNPDLFELVGNDEHRQLAREAVAKSLVLLKNEDDLLPISKDIPMIFLAGEGADNIGLQCGGWTIQWQGASGAITPGTTIKDAFLSTTRGRVQFNRFGKYENILDQSGQPIIADVGVVVISERPYAEGQGDSDNLVLNQIDVDLITRVSERSQKVVVIIISGRPLVIADYLDMADAWVAAWLPGTEGQGIADVIFGDLPFTGKTPFSWPASMDQLPLGSSEDAPLFPLGHGLDR